jgi:Cytochrome P460
LSSGLGMSYGAEPGGEPSFDNVFVAPEAYREFVATGKWPEKTMFVLEERASISKGSINQSGHFQGALMGFEAEVKDTSRFAGGWAFFNLSGGVSSATALPKSAPCYSCHAQHGAVDNTFVQFYPTLFAVAKAKGTLRAAY